MKSKTSCAAGALVLATSLALPALANDAAVERAFKDKKVTITVGFDAGGTYGLYSQIMAHHLKPFIPGHPTIVVQYMPGAGGIKASNYAFNVAAKTGLNLFMPPDTVVISNILEPKTTRYKANQFYYLGNAVQTNSVLVFRSDKNINTLADLQKTPVIAGSTGTGSQTFLLPAMLNGVFGTKIKIIQGYKGSQKAMLAMEQKETDGASLTWASWTATRGKWFETGYAKPVLQLGVNKDPALQNLPMLTDLAVTPEQKQIVGFMASLGAVGRSLTVPPKTPAHISASLRAAFEKMAYSPAFKEEANRRKLDVAPMKGEDLQKVVGEMMKVSPEVATMAREAIMVRGRKVEGETSPRERRGRPAR